MFLYLWDIYRMGWPPRPILGMAWTSIGLVAASLFGLAALMACRVITNHVMDKRTPTREWLGDVRLAEPICFVLIVLALVLAGVSGIQYFV